MLGTQAGCQRRLAQGVDSRASVEGGWASSKSWRLAFCTFLTPAFSTSPHLPPLPQAPSPRVPQSALPPLPWGCQETHLQALSGC